MEGAYQYTDQQLKNLHGSLAEWVSGRQNEKYIGSSEQNARPQRELGKEYVERNRRSQKFRQVGRYNCYLREDI